MPGRAEQWLHSQLAGKILWCARRVHSELQFGFVEKVYENALVLELRAAGLEVVQQAPIDVRYRGQLVGQFVADLLVNGVVIVEIKAVEKIIPAHEVQLVNYLRATEIELGIVVNFGPQFDQNRRILTNDRKGNRVFPSV